MRGERLIKEIKSIIPFQFRIRDSSENTYIGVHGEVWINLTISPSYIYDFTISDWYGHREWIKVNASEKYKIFQLIDDFYARNKFYKHKEPCVKIMSISEKYQILQLISEALSK